MSADAGFEWFRARAAADAAEARQRVEAMREAHRADQDRINAAAVDADACPVCWCLDTGGAICDACRSAS